MLHKLFMMVGPPGGGKSTWVKDSVAGWEVLGRNVKVVSRDAIRFSMLQEEDDYFEREDEVFAAFIKEIADSIQRNEITFADATHLSEDGRNKVLDLLDLTNVELIAVVVRPPLEVCLERNELRTGRAKVPRGVIRRMWFSMTDPAHDEKYKFTKVIKVVK
jgi:protein phosphatase